jgi:hypothetical protein
VNRSPEIAQLATALAAAQGEIEGASKDTLNPHFGKAYADLASVWEACRAPLSKASLAVIQTPVAEGARVAVETLLVHKSGEWISNELVMIAAAANPQAVGSAITYARRYALMAIVGVAPAEDDGNSATGRPQQPPPATYVKPPPQASKPPPAKPVPSAPAPVKVTPPAETKAPEPRDAVPAEPKPAPQAAPAPEQPAANDNGQAMDLARGLRDAKTPAELDKLVPRFKTLTEAEKADLRPLYVSRMKELTGAAA